MHFHTRVLVVATVVALVLFVVPAGRWRMKAHEHYLLEKSILAEFRKNVSDARPFVEMKCQTTADMERYDSGKECRIKKALLEHAKPEDQAIYLREELNSIWFDERQELNLDHWFRIVVLSSSVAFCIELLAVIYFWSVNDTMELRGYTLPSRKKQS